MDINKLHLELNKKLESKNDFFDFAKNLILEDNHTSLLDAIQCKFFKQLETLYGNEFIKILNQIWADTLNFTYETDPLKTSFRDKNNFELYFPIAINKLWNLLKLWSDDFDILNLATSKNIPDNCTIEDILAYGINNRTEKLLPFLSAHIEKNNSYINPDIIRGIIKSSPSSLHLKLFELLLNENTDVELKKSILSNADCGHIGAFKTLISLILDKELYYSNEVVDSIYGWTGIKLIFLYTDEIKLFFTIINDVLINKNKKSAIYSQGNESEYLFFSLWADGLRNLSAMKEKLLLLNTGKNNIEILNALRYLHLVGTEEEKMEATLFRMKKKINPLYAYYVIQNYVTSVTYPSLAEGFKCSIEEQKKITTIPANSFLKDANTLDKHFEVFYNLAIDMNQHLYSYEKPFCWSEYIKDPKGIFFKLFDIVVYDNFSEEKIDKLCDIVLYSVDEVILFFLINFVKGGRTERQRNFVLFLLKEGSSLLKERTVLAIKRSKKILTPEEKEAVINLFNPSIKNSHRLLIITHILGFEKNSMLEIVSEIVLAKNNPLKKEAAEIFLKRLRNNVSFPFFFQEYKEKKENASTKKKKKEAISLEEEAEEATEKEYIYLRKTIKKSGFGIYNSQNPPFLFDSENVITSEISSIKDFFNLDIKDFEFDLNRFGSYHFLKDFSLNNLLEIDFALTFEKFFDLEDKVNKKTHSAFSRSISNSFNIEKMKKISILARKGDSTPQKILEKIKKKYHVKFNAKELFNVKMDLINCFFKTLSDRECSNIRIINFMKALFSLISDRELGNTNMFRTFFFTYYVFYYKSNFYEFNKLSILHYIKAFNMGLILSDEVYKELLERENCFKHLSYFLNLSYDEKKKYPFDPKAESKIVSTIVRLERNRKNYFIKSELTHLVPALKKVEGVSLLFSILETMEYNKIEIVADFSLKSLTKKETLNYLLSISQPTINDTVSDIKELTFLLDNPYSLKKALLFTAVHILKWRKILSIYLNYKYLDEVYWFFKVHLNYEKNFKNRLILLKYTSIKPEEFEKGRFDIKWFRKLHDSVGELEFEQIYGSFKTTLIKSEVSENFTASLSGIFNFKDINSLEKEIENKNKKAMLCYSLLPYGKLLDKSIEDIYDTIRYRARTDDSITKSQLEITNVALNNFLDNIGFSSRVFLELSLDKEHQPLLRNFLKNDHITAAYIDFIPPDKFVLKKYDTEKPNSYQREKYIMKAYEAVRNYNILIKDLIEHLKFCMNTRSEMLHTEISLASKNPLTSLIIKNIIFDIDGEHFGFPKGDSFITVEGKSIPVGKSNKIKIAHPLEMPADIIKKFRNYFKKNNIIQEFKQLEMETYILKNKESYKNEIIHFLDKYLCYNTLYELLIDHRWEKVDENIFLKVYLQDNLAVKLEIQYENTAASNSKKMASIDSVTFFDIQKNIPESFSKIPIRILSDILYDLNHIFNHVDNQN